MQGIYSVVLYTFLFVLFVKTNKTKRKVTWMLLSVRHACVFKTNYLYTVILSAYVSLLHAYHDKYYSHACYVHHAARSK